MIPLIPHASSFFWSHSLLNVPLSLKSLSIEKRHEPPFFFSGFDRLYTPQVSSFQVVHGIFLLISTHIYSCMDIHRRAGSGHCLFAMLHVVHDG